MTNLAAVYRKLRDIGKPIQKAVWRLVKEHRHDLGPGGHSLARKVIDVLFPSIMNELMGKAKKADYPSLLDMSIRGATAKPFLDRLLDLIKHTKALSYEPDLADWTEILERLWPEFLEAQEQVDDAVRQMTAAAILNINKRQDRRMARLIFRLLSDLRTT